MGLKMARVILFTRQMEMMTVFYRDVMGLNQLSDGKGWREFDAGGLTVALHSGPPTPKAKGPKIVFYAKDVAKTRALLNKRGAKFGDAKEGEFVLCDGRDPDGNAIQISNR